MSQKNRKVPRPLFIDPNQRYTLVETHAALGQSHVNTFRDIKRGVLKTIMDGRRRYVLGSEIIRRSSCGLSMTAQQAITVQQAAMLRDVEAA